MERNAGRGAERGGLRLGSESARTLRPPGDWHGVRERPPRAPAAEAALEPPTLPGLAAQVRARLPVVAARMSLQERTFRPVWRLLGALLDLGRLPPGAVEAAIGDAALTVLLETVHSEYRRIAVSARLQGVIAAADLGAALATDSPCAPCSAWCDCPRCTRP